MSKSKNTTLYCFSPLVMLATFFIETSAALYTLFRYRRDLTAKLVTTLLGALAVFQLAEYMICQGAFLLSSLEWARVGYAAITILPPLGIHLGMQIAKKKNVPLLVTAYGSAFVFTTFFLFIGQGMQSQQCLGNYIIFSIAPYAVIPYTLYYYGWLFVGVYVFMNYRDHIQSQKRKQALFWLSVGYLTFIVPTTIVNIIDPKTISGIPSIMCGFAVLMAMCLLFKVSPLVLNDTRSIEAPATSTV